MSCCSTVTAYISLGSNLGDRQVTVESALKMLDASPGIEISKQSRFVETEPVGPIAQPKFLNAVAEIVTTQSPPELLQTLLGIEQQHGRVRSERWGPRTLDLDILLYGDEAFDEPGLTIPHPHMHERLFVLEPLTEIAPEAVHPLLGMTARQLLERASFHESIHST